MQLHVIITNPCKKTFEACPGCCFTHSNNKWPGAMLVLCEENILFYVYFTRGQPCYENLGCV